MELDDLRLFVKIVERDGLGAAGRELGLAPSTVSERLAHLERQLGTSLLNRTTRALSLTDEGRTLLEGARRLLADARELESRIVSGTREVSGPIRLTAPEDLGRQFIAPLVGRFLAEHPQVSIDLHLADGYVDLVRGGFDFAVRYGLLADSSMKSRPLGRSPRVVVASPCYLQKHGTPVHPRDLEHHECLLMRLGQNVNRQWPFEIEGRLQTVFVKGRTIANDGGVIRRFCLDGRGIALKSAWDIEADLTSGALVELLPDFSASPTALQIVYPDALTQPSRVRLLMDVISAHFAPDSMRQ